MRVAALYDIHGNLPALEAVLEDVRRTGIDLVVVGGDVVPGPMPLECLAALRALDPPTKLIFGNGEREVLAERAGEETGNVPERFREIVRWVARRLGPDEAGPMASWPATVDVEIPPLGKVLFCHGTPRSDTEIFTRLTPEERLRPIFEDVDANLVVCGHTHMQFDRKVGAVRVVNAGSVGMPFGAPGAYWLLLGPDVEPRRTSYDRDLAAARIRDTTYPQAEEFAAGNVLRVPSEEQMLEAFARSEPR